MDMELYGTLRILHFRVFTVQCWTICRRCIVLSSCQKYFMLYVMFHAIVTSGTMAEHNNGRLNTIGPTPQATHDDVR